MKKTDKPGKNTITIHVMPNTTLEWFRETIKQQAKELQPYRVEVTKPYCADINEIMAECSKHGCVVKFV